MLLSASFQITEVYTSDCSSKVTMTATWIGGIGKSTGWPGPGRDVRKHEREPRRWDRTAAAATRWRTPATGCRSGFNVKADLDKIGASASNITFRVWEDGNTNLADHKQLTTTRPLR